MDGPLVSSAVQSLLDWAAQYLDQHVDGLAMAAPPPMFSTPGPKVRAPLTGAGVWVSVFFPSFCGRPIQ